MLLKLNYVSSAWHVVVYIFHLYSHLLLFLASLGLQSQSEFNSDSIIYFKRKLHFIITIKYHLIFTSPLKLSLLYNLTPNEDLTVKLDKRANYNFPSQIITRFSNTSRNFNSLQLIPTNYTSLCDFIFQLAKFFISNSFHPSSCWPSSYLKK